MRANMKRLALCSLLAALFAGVVVAPAWAGGIGPLKARIVSVLDELGVTTGGVYAGGGGGAIDGTADQWGVTADALRPIGDDTENIGDATHLVQEMFVNKLTGMANGIEFDGDFVFASTNATDDIELQPGASGGVSIPTGTGLSVSAPITLATYTAGTLPAATTAGQIIYVSDGAAGSPVLAFSNGTNWLRVDTLAAVSGS
jgi:hypothetical protein